MSRQILQNYNQIRASIPSAKDEFIRDYSAIKEDVAQAEKNIANLSPQFGVGSPEGAVTSNLSLAYFDTTNKPINVTMWINEDVGSKTGWMEVV